ncbi:MAG TPA: threonine/serine exporter family protein [Clostridiaceae bacterium]|nr:threonine/serine exporter family protein [Clostridiaceae bacterium]
MEQGKILDIAIKTGSALLRYGAETYRVEDTITRICGSYGLTCEAFVLPTGIIVSLEGENGISSICKRISSRTVDLARISYLNNLSRKIAMEAPEYDEVMEELNRINELNRYSKPAIIACSAFTAFIYVTLFGGNLVEALFAFLIGIILGILRLIFSKSSSFPFIEYFAGGFVAGILSWLLTLAAPQVNPYIIITGAVVNMLPGVALTNGIRDLLYGDIVSGLARIGEALMVVAVVAAGTGIGLTLLFIGGPV